MSDITPFRISIPQSRLDRLKQQLSLYDLPHAEIPESSSSPAWSRGPPLTSISQLATYWRDTYDWRAHEKRLNDSMPQFMTEILLDDFGIFDIHFVHQTASVENAIPLLFVHGWPGSFLEVTKILPLLVQGDGSKDGVRFHVVAPSLVNFGFSGPSLKAGFDVRKHGEICHKLMLKLGYEQYVVQGGDLGYGIARYLALTYPSNVPAHHINLAIPREPTLTSNPLLFAKSQATPLSDYEKAGLAQTAYHLKEGTGYSAIQNTRPQTIGIALTTHPVALLAWIYDKLHAWTDSYPWTPDEILTWISIYLFSTAGPSSSLKIYYDEAHPLNPSIRGIFGSNGGMYSSGSKLGVSRFPKELCLRPKLWHEGMGPLVFMREHDKGGHFAAWEVPERLVGDLRDMFGRGGGAESVIQGSSGFGEERAKL
jgi:pimeloyl-ACP methyl ester carboxylesterase